MEVDDMGARKDEKLRMATMETLRHLENLE